MPIGASTREIYRSGPELALEPLGRLVERAGVRTGRQVLPARVADHERDVCALARLDRTVGLRERGVQDRAGGDADEQPLLVDELPRAPQRVLGADREARVEHRRV